MERLQLVSRGPEVQIFTNSLENQDLRARGNGAGEVTAGSSTGRVLCLTYCG